jgi:hypothetical protein
MPPLAEWHEFYTLLGTASATMVGLLFVAVTVASGAFSGGRQAALRVFLSASVVNFGLILVVSLIELAPVRSPILLGTLIVGCAGFGLAHSGLACRDTMRDGLIALIDLEDRILYIAMPILSYLFVAGSGVMLALRLDLGSIALASSMALLLAVGLHNAWDITVWGIIRKQ